MPASSQLSSTNRAPRGWRWLSTLFGNRDVVDVPPSRDLGPAADAPTGLSQAVDGPWATVRDTLGGFRASDRRAIRSLARDTAVGREMNPGTEILGHALRGGGVRGDRGRDRHLIRRR